MENGTIKSLSSDRGFGFITLADGREVFFHRSALANPNQFSDLDEGDQVEVDVDPAAPKGPRAKTVRLIETSAA